jgi:cysteinyl-tRNA synthetase
MANVWMHNAFMQVEGEKMSKSLGNFVTIHELLRATKFGGRSWPGEVLRLAMLRTHYRQPIDWTVKALEEAEATLDRWYEAVGDVEARGDPDEDVLNALVDDLNTPEAIARLHRLAQPDGAGTASFDPSGRSRTLSAEILKTSANLLGILRQTKSERHTLALSDAQIDASEIDAIIAERAQARATRNWAESDRLRDHLATLGVAIKDTKDGATTWELKR